MNGKYTLIVRKSPLNVVSNDPLVMPEFKPMDANTALRQAGHHAKTLRLKLVDDFPPALGNMSKGESLLVAKADDDTKYMYLLKVSDGGR